MADRRCDDRCGCPVPCPGGTAYSGLEPILRSGPTLYAHAGSTAAVILARAGGSGREPEWVRLLAHAGRPAPVRRAQPKAVSERCNLPQLCW
ncbi:hypothetical protein FCM35_KLT14368 [Carex littledalei]|uniref:Uncharacterized protein n=1 Tax=Carex littledalei TaxID=544730 RepID=A0A833Q8F4_9POAL|nr:hypothetical protein FCM35_KLT14368 [Carex littledalei]